MTEKSGPFASSGAGMQESDWLTLEDVVQPYSGYVQNYLNELAVSQHSPLAAMSVDVATGGAVVKSSRYLNPAIKTVTIDAADSTQDRIDLVVVQRTLADPASTIIATVHKGSLYTAGTAVAPTRTTSSSVYEIVLAQVLVVHGTTAITTAMITDKRESTDCGAYAPPVGGLTIDPATGDFDFDGQKLVNIADPTADTDADTKSARDDAIATAISGVAATIAGRIVARTTHSTPGSGTHTTNAETHYLRITLIGGGGGGGGCSRGADYRGGGGGGSGAYAKHYWIAVDPSTGYSYTVGAGGTAGVNNLSGLGTAGGNGGASTITIGGTTYSAPAGQGGQCSTSSGGAGGAAATTPTTGDERIAGLAGTAGGMGSSTGIAAGALINVPVLVALGFGNGGNGGGISGSEFTPTAGTSGEIIIEEYS